MSTSHEQKQQIQQLAGQPAQNPAPRSQTKGSALRRNYFASRISPIPIEARQVPRILASRDLTAATVVVVEDDGFQFQVKPRQGRLGTDGDQQVDDEDEHKGVAAADVPGAAPDAAGDRQLRRSTRKRKQRILNPPSSSSASSQQQKELQKQQQQQRLERRSRAALAQAALDFQYPAMVPFDARQALQVSPLPSSATDEEHFLHYAQLMLEHELQQFGAHSRAFRQQQQLHLLNSNAGGGLAGERHSKRLKGQQQQQQSSLPPSSLAAQQQPDAPPMDSSEELVQAGEVEEVLRPLDDVFKFLEKQLNRASGRFLDSYRAQFVVPAVKEARSRSLQAGKSLQPNPMNQHLQDQIRVFDGLLHNMSSEIERLSQAQHQWTRALAAAEGVLPQLRMARDQDDGRQDQGQLGVLAELGQAAEAIDPGLGVLLANLQSRSVEPSLENQQFLEASPVDKLSAALPEAFDYISLRSDSIQSSLRQLEEAAALAQEEQASRAAHASSRALRNFDYPGTPKLIKDLLGR